MKNIGMKLTIDSLKIFHLEQGEYEEEQSLKQSLTLKQEIKKKAKLLIMPL